MTSGLSPDKQEFFALIIDYNYLLTEINFLGQLEDNQFKGLSHFDSITSTYLTNANLNFFAVYMNQPHSHTECKTKMVFVF